MKHQFNEVRATQAAARLLRLSGSQLNYMVLIKFLYLIDRAALLRWGRLITYDDRFEMKLGPMLSHVHDLITAEDVESKFWRQFIATDAYAVSLVGDPGDGELSEAEESLIDEVFQQYRHVKDDPFEFANVLHRTLPELKGIQEGRLPIEVERILASEKLPDSTIQSIRDDLDAAASAQIFAPRH